MSRNRLSSQCSCGYQLELRNATTRPLLFWEYLKAIGIQEPEEYPYYFEYMEMIVCQVCCPECGRLYCAWLNNKTGVYPFDTSYWYSFNDETGERDRLITGEKLR